MDFAWTPEQEELSRTLRTFTRKELAPRSRQWDKHGEFPWDAWRRMGELGLLGFRHPTEFGGNEIDLVSMGIATEEIARGDFSCTYGIQLAGLAGQILGQGGSDEVKTRWLPSTASGECIVALAAQAAIVFARTGGGSGARGVTAFLVPLDLPGVSRSPLGDLGARAITRAVLAFDHVKIPLSHRVGAEGTGFYQVMQGFDYNRVLIGLACLGVAQISLEETMAYVKERKAFGRPLATFEGVSFPIAEAATHIDGARWLCYRALWLADHDLPHTKESAMVKWWAPKLSVDAIHQCLLLHGHYGYTDELPFEQRLRDVIGLELGDGTAQIMKVIVARELMGRESLPY
jgi:cyclohexanecarboxyl-CoA dehydrogenase